MDDDFDSDFDDVDVALESNPDPRCPCILLLDTSSSMAGAPVAALNAGLQTLQQDIRKDDLASRRTDIAIITFGNGGVQTMQDFVAAGSFRAPMLSAGGSTPMGAAIIHAFDMLHKRKQQYQKSGIRRYYRPWLFMITDGAPTDNWQAAAQQVHNEENAKACAFFAIGVANADMNTLAQIATRRPLMLQGLKFTELFLWLSSSQKRVSASQVGEEVGLEPPVGWATV
ncbi:MAG: vWA domain-containing protein [Ktedonobacteraceae bacterium]